MFWGSILWHRGLNCHLPCWYLTEALVQVLDTQLPIQLPTEESGKQWETIQVPGLLTPTWEAWMECQALAWSTPGQCGHLVRESDDGNPVFLSFFCHSSFQINCFYFRFLFCLFFKNVYCMMLSSFSYALSTNSGIPSLCKRENGMLRILARAFLNKIG